VVLDYATKDEHGQAVPVRIAVPIRRFPCRFGGRRGTVTLIGGK